MLIIWIRIFEVAGGKLTQLFYVFMEGVSIFFEPSWFGEGVCSWISPFFVSLIFDVLFLFLKVKGICREEQRSCF